MPKLCEYQNCRKRASYGFFYGKPERCKEHKENRKPQYSICQCGSHRPYFNYEGEARPMYCKKCRKVGMVNVRDKKRCECGKYVPYYNHMDKKPMYCKKCKQDGMVNVRDKRRCTCGKRSSFNYKERTKPICCNKCKKKGMINITIKKCQCGQSSPIFNYKKQTKPICCNKCKKEGMVDIVHKKCLCKLSRPSFNYKGETKPICCKNCKKVGMIDVVHNHCSCGKIPSYNYNGKKNPICCNGCKKKGMINITIKKCQCGKSTALYNYKGKSTPICCSRCKSEEMIDIVHKRCPNCKDWPDFQCSNKKYKGYCTRCFQHLFPNDPLTFQIRSKSKEIAVRDFINANFEGFIHDKPLYTGQCDCSHRRRIDHRKQIGNTILAIETDEHQHKGYDKQDETIRYNDVYMIFSGKWIFIRFNPDKYTNKKGKRRNPMIATRLIRLKQEIEKQINRIKKEKKIKLVENIKLNYDKFD